MKIVSAQKNFTVGDLNGNAEKIISTVKEYDHKDNLVVFSELCVSGYPPLDLLDNDQFIDDQLFTVSHILKETSMCNSYFVVGYFRRNSKRPGKPLFNSLSVCHKGEILYTYDKVLLPTYDVFDEDRYFEPGDSLPTYTFSGCKVGFAICEDLWPTNRYRQNPIDQISNVWCDFVISINASPSTVGKHEERLRLIQGHAKRFQLDIIYVNQVGGNDDIVFDGNSFCVDRNGDLRSHSRSFEEDVKIIDKDINWGVQPPVSSYDKAAVGANHVLNCPHEKFYMSKSPDAEFFCKQAELGLRDYLRKTGFSKVAIGESGGIDSAVTTAIAVQAVGPKNVIAVTMPSAYSSMGSVEDSEDLCDKLGVKLLTIPIMEQYDKFMEVFNSEYGPALPGVTEQNVQARIRGQILMAISNREGALVLSTGNKSELSMGFCTIYGDMSGGINPIADCYKMEVYAMGRYLGIPERIMSKEPSAELSPNQIDRDSLPPYPVLDTALRYFIENEGCEEAVYELLEKNGWTGDKIYRMLRTAEFKRRQAALGLKMHKKAFGFGRRYPIVNKYNYKEVRNSLNML
jgi:NAD+ synthetase